MSGDSITVLAKCDDEKSEVLYMDFRVGVRSGKCAALAKVEELTPEEKHSGVITRSIPSSAKNYKVYFQNEYGIWTQPMTGINT